MTAQRPEFLWLLALAAPMLAAHLYRIRRRKHLVPYLRFWEDIQGQERWRSLWSRLKEAVLLLINLMILGLVTVIAADVQIPGVSPRPRHYVILMDDTPSMSAEDRMSRAREEARQWRSRYLRRIDRATWMTFSGRLLEQDLTYPVSFSEASSLKAHHERILRSFPGATLVYISDGGEELPEAPRIIIGREAANVALSHPEWDGDAFSILVQNHSRQSVSGTLKINRETFPLTLQPNEQRRWSGVLLLSKGEVLVRAQWEPTDAFSLDQMVYSVRPSHEPGPVIVFTQAPISAFLYHALDLLATYGIVSRDQIADRPDRFLEIKDAIEEDYWMIFNGSAPKEPVSRGRALFLGVPAEALPVRVTRVVDRPKVQKVWEGLGVQSGAFSVRRTQVFAREDDVVPLIETDEGPIAVAGKRGGLTFVALGFNLDQSDLQMTPVFPLLMRGVALWSKSARLYPSAGVTGETLINRFRIVDSEVRLHYENGTVREWSDSVRDGFRPILLQAPGFYAVSGETFQEVIGVNFSDLSESKLDPQAQTDLQGLTEPAWWEHVPLSAIAAVLALLLSLLEWGLAVRRA